jgi:hypothetical protein
MRNAIRSVSIEAGEPRGGGKILFGDSERVEREEKQRL